MKHKKLKDLILSDDFMFKHVMSDVEVARLFLEALFNKKVKSIEKVMSQKDLSDSTERHGTILDIYLEGDDRLYDIEMQKGKGDIPRRVRYYQSSLDRFSLNPGQDYRNLRDTAIIFVCTYDLFGLGRPIYLKQSYIADVPNYVYYDGTTTVFLNSVYTEPTEINESLREFLSIVNGSTSSNTLLGKIVQERINYVKTCEEDKYMNFVEEFNDARYEAKMEGIIEGEMKGVMKEKDAMISTMISKFSLDDIAMCVRLSKDEVLERIKVMGLNYKSNSVELLNLTGNDQ